MKKRCFLSVLSLAFFLVSCSGPISNTNNSDPGNGQTDDGNGNQGEGQGGQGQGEGGQGQGEGGEGGEGETQKPEVLPTISYVKVMVPTNYTKIWAWTDSGNLFSAWPGVDLKAYDSDWKTYDFLEYSKIYVIVSENGNNQTGDFQCTAAGYWWLKNGQWINSNTVPTNGGGTQIVDGIPDVNEPTGNHKLVKKADTYLDLPLWSDLPESHWKCINPYTGARHDFREESIYFMMTTRFYDGDSSNNVHCWDGSKNLADDPEWRGDFKGLIEKMDYIKALGFTAIWITPVVQNASGLDYHGYHTLNFKKVDERYESTDVKFQDVINAAHARDMKIVLDVVFNHSSNNGEENLFPMFKKKTGDYTINGLERQDNDLLPSNYYQMDGRQQFQARIKSMKDFRKDGGKDDEYIYHHEKNMGYETYIEQTGSMAGDCIDLNTENPTVANYLVEAYGEFIKMGVDAFRIDTMKHISRLTFNKYLFPAFQEYAKRCGNNYFFMFGEVCTRVREVWNHGLACDSAPFYTWKENKTYDWGTTGKNLASVRQNWDDNANTNQRSTDNAYLSNNTYHTPDHSQWTGTSVIDFPMHWNFQYARDAYKVAVNNDKWYNDATYNVVYVDSHDYGPDGNEKVRYKEGTNAWKENMSLMFTFRGVPCIYYGSEIEFQKGKTIDEGANLALKESGRAYYGENLKGSVTASDFGVYTASGTVSNTLNSTLSKHLQKLNKIRLKVPALSKGQYKSYGDLKFVRRYTSGGVDSVAAVAISGGCTFDNLPNGTYEELYNGGTQNVTNGRLNASVSGQGNIQIWVKK